jgi:hypothetical protein
VAKDCRRASQPSEGEENVMTVTKRPGFQAENAIKKGHFAPCATVPFFKFWQKS